MNDTLVQPEQVNDQDFAAERDALQGGADLMLQLLSQKVELVCVTDQTGGTLTLVPAGTEAGDAQRLDGLHHRVERIEATLEAGSSQPMAGSAALTATVENMAPITSHPGGRKVIIEEKVIGDKHLSPLATINFPHPS